MNSNDLVNIGEILDEDFAEKFIRHQLMSALEDAQTDQDQALANALHVVIALLQRPRPIYGRILRWIIFFI